MKPLVRCVLLLSLSAASLASLGAPLARTLWNLHDGPETDKSWIVGSRSAPLDGILRIGRLARSGVGNPYATSIDPKKLEEFLARLEKGEIEEVELEEQLFEGKWASTPFVLRRINRVLCRVHMVLAEQCADLPLLVCPPRNLLPNELKSLQRYILQGGFVVLELGTEARRRALFGSAAVLPRSSTKIPKLTRLGLEEAQFIERQGRVIGMITNRRDILGVLNQRKRWKGLQSLFSWVIQNSVKLRVLGGQPFMVRSAVRKGADLQVRVSIPSHPGARQASVDAALVDIDGKVRWREIRRTSAEFETFRIRCPEKLIDPVGTRIQLRWRSRGVVIRVAPSIEALVGTSNLQLLGSTVAQAGGAYAVRVLATDSRTGEAIADQPQRIVIERDGVELAQVLAITDAHGTVDAQLMIPDAVTAGPAILRVGRASVKIEVRREFRLHLVTDRKLYRANDTIHARVMLRRFPSGLPAANQTVTLEIKTSGGGGNARKTVKTSPHGIASTSFTFVDQQPGNCRLTAKGGSASATIDLRVKAFELPRFVLEVEPTEVVCRADERVPVTLRARYVDGARLIGAEVTVRTQGARSDKRSGKTDTEGVFRMVCSPLLKGGRRGSLVSLVVKDKDGRIEEVHVPVRRIDSSIELQLRYLSVPVVGQPLRVQVVARDSRGRPVGGDIGWTAAGPLHPETGVGRDGSVKLGADGTAIFTVRPNRRDVMVRVYWSNHGVTSRKRFLVSCQAADLQNPVVLPSDLVTRVGRVLSVKVLPCSGTMFLDLCREGVTIRTLAASSSNGRVDFRVPIGAELAGFLTLRAYGLNRNREEPWQNRRLFGTAQQILVLRDTELSVEARPDRPQYRPGQTARVTIEVRDRKGAPSPGVLGYWAVDEALLALAPWDSAAETLFDSAPTKPRPQQLALMRVDPGSGFQDALSVFGRPRPIGKTAVYSLCFDWLTSRRAAVAKQALEAGRAKIKALRLAVIDGLGRIPLRKYPDTKSIQDTLRWLISHGYLEEQALMDPWGGRLESLPNNTWCCWGPDGEIGSGDDSLNQWCYSELFDALPQKTRLFLRFVKQQRDLEAIEEEEVSEEEEEMIDSAFDSKQWNTAIGLGGGASGRFGGRARGQRGLVRAPSPRVRKDHSPTLVFVPEQVVGPDGNVILEVPLADSTTTWKMRFVASTLAGQTGVGEASLVVTQPFQVEPWLASRLTAGDFIEIPTLVRNGQDKAIRAQLELTSTSGSDTAPVSVVGVAKASVGVDPKSSSVHRFGLRAERAGSAQVRVTGAVVGGKESDAVERRLHVRPYGRARNKTQQSTVTAEKPWRTQWRVGESEVAEARLRLTILPDALAGTIAGFEGLMQEPHGCFEQTSSTLYPMVLALGILEARQQQGVIVPQRTLEMARRHVAHGYRRLLQFEVGNQTGGFELYGRKPANLMLTAYGLLEFHEIAKVHAVEPALIPRIRKFLLAGLRKDGSFEASYFGTLANAKANRFRTTAYVAWALAATGEPSARTTHWLTEHYHGIEDTYGLALAALAFAHTLGSKDLGRQLMKHLLSSAIVDGDGRFWTPTGETWVGSRGRSARTETTALVANALLAVDLDAVAVLDWLAARRTPSGHFGTTFSTVLALSAFARAESGAALDTAATVHIALDGKRLATRQLAAGVSEPIRLDLGASLAKGDHTVTLTVVGDRRPRAGLSLTTWEPWNSEVLAPRGRVALEVDWPVDPVAVGRLHWCKIELRNPSKQGARNVVVEVGLPPGCTVDERDLQGPKPARVERGDGRLVLYLDRLAPTDVLSYRLGFTPRYKLDVRTQPSKAYEYYTPEEGHLLAPSRVRTR